MMALQAPRETTGAMAPAAPSSQDGGAGWTGAARGSHNLESINIRGRWFGKEHNKFLEGVLLHQCQWDKIAKLVRTRTAVQVRSHAQKFLAKLGDDAETNRHARVLVRAASDC